MEDCIDVLGVRHTKEYEDRTNDKTNDTGR